MVNSYVQLGLNDPGHPLLHDSARSLVPKAEISQDQGSEGELECVQRCAVLGVTQSQEGQSLDLRPASTDRSPACFLVCHLRPLHVDFPSREPRLAGAAVLHRVDAPLIPTEGRVGFLAIQEREGPRSLRRAQLGRVIGPQVSK